MSDNANTSQAGFQELVRILEEAVRAGITLLSLEYEGRELIVYYRAGNVGLGAPRIAADLQQAVMDELVKRAGLGRKSKGKMPVSLLGRDYELIVEEYENFDDPAFNLTIKTPKRKAGK